jgi:hypothetical protein
MQLSEFVLPFDYNIATLYYIRFPVSLQFCIDKKKNLFLSAVQEKI